MRNKYSFEQHGKDNMKVGDGQTFKDRCDRYYLQVRALSYLLKQFSPLTNADICQFIGMTPNNLKNLANNGRIQCKSINMDEVYRLEKRFVKNLSITVDECQKAQVNHLRNQYVPWELKPGYRG